MKLRLLCSFFLAGLLGAQQTSGVFPAPCGAAVPVAQAYDLSIDLVGKPAAGATVKVYTFVRTVTFQANWSGAQVSCGANATASATYTINKNGASTGTVVIGAGTCTAAFTTAGGLILTFLPGDRLTVTAPGSQDATLADVGFTLPGTF